jgi:lysine-N-methylase
MMNTSAPIHLPVFQRFDCGNCTCCCRDRVINVNDADRKRILAAGWQERMAGQPLWIEYRFGGRRLYRLARRDDGACLFLGPDNLCRIHAENGPATKPLACRMYPFVVVPGVGGVRVDLRMDCPSAATNHGRTLSAHAAEIGRLAAESEITKGSPKVPAWGAERELSSTEFGAVVAAFEEILRRTAVPVRVRLQAGCQLLDLMYAARIDKVRDERFVELMDLLATAAIEEADTSEGGDGDSADERSEDVRLPLKERSGRLFRQWLFLHTIADDPESLTDGRIRRLCNSWRRYGYARRFAAGRGAVPQVRPSWPPITFETIDAVRPAPDDGLEPLIRAMRLKLDAHAFAGPAYFGYDLLAGLTALWLLPGVVGWLARLEAVRRGGQALTAEDVLAGVRQAHHTFGVSPVFARISERLRMRGLARPGVPAAVLHRYAP